MAALFTFFDNWRAHRALSEVSNTVATFCDGLQRHFVEEEDNSLQENNVNSVINKAIGAGKCDLSRAFDTFSYSVGSKQLQGNKETLRLQTRAFLNGIMPELLNEERTRLSDKMIESINRIPVTVSRSEDESNMSTYELLLKRTGATEEQLALGFMKAAITSYGQRAIDSISSEANLSAKEREEIKNIPLSAQEIKNHPLWIKEVNGESLSSNEQEELAKLKVKVQQEEAFNAAPVLSSFCDEITLKEGLSIREKPYYWVPKVVNEENLSKIIAKYEHLIDQLYQGEWIGEDIHHKLKEKIDNAYGWQDFENSLPIATKQEKISSLCKEMSVMLVQVTSDTIMSEQNRLSSPYAVNFFIKLLRLIWDPDLWKDDVERSHEHRYKIQMTLQKLDDQLKRVELNESSSINRTQEEQEPLLKANTPERSELLAGEAMEENDPLLEEKSDVVSNAKHV